ncbi:hypothetical protein HHX48_03775 [Salinimonas sp. HHU 13199]|uniref:PEP-CTERM protein-sorting domain-containing protein n=1 Tax=Salinimonas profundi TaxID=2729140 RepID=A0ABR8LLC9_9ALTE|nr:hypothetical protein [Salinimonas profundi]MBD3584854.1 hypothetical protein [Salinimonas profundi]
MNTGIRQLIWGAGLLLGLSTQTASADLINTDFSSGFSGWRAEIISFNYPSGMDSSETGNIFNQFSDNFSLSDNGVTLTTSSDAMNDYWSVSMFQEVMLSEDIQTLSLNLQASVTDAATDLFYVQLRDLSTNDAIDLTAGGQFDISLWAGQWVSLEFGVMDFDFIPADSITVSDISLSYASVPAPATGVLLMVGALAALRRKTY